jgi:hypothetical protein
MGMPEQNKEEKEKNKKSVEQQPPTGRPPEEETNPEATVDQDPGERQKRNQGWQKEDPLAS